MNMCKTVVAVCKYSTIQRTLTVVAVCGICFFLFFKQELYKLYIFTKINSLKYNINKKV